MSLRVVEGAFAGSSPDLSNVPTTNIFRQLLPLALVRVKVLRTPSLLKASNPIVYREMGEITVRNDTNGNHMTGMKLGPGKGMTTEVTPSVTPSVTLSNDPAAEATKGGLESLQTGQSLLTLFDTEPTTPMTQKAFHGKFGDQAMKIGLIDMTVEKVA